MDPHGLTVPTVLIEGRLCGFHELAEHLTAAVVSDALDQLGFREQSPRVPIRPLTTNEPRALVGRCKTTLWADMAHADPEPYALELAAVDGLKSGDVFIAAANGSDRSGIWGELLSTAAQASGARGAIVDGHVRDLRRMTAMGFPVHARGARVHDSRDRQRVIDVDVPVSIGGVLFRPGDIVVADEDGIVVVPREVEEEALTRAWRKVHDENRVRDALREGMSAAEAFRVFGVL